MGKGLDDLRAIVRRRAGLADSKSTHHIGKSHGRAHASNTGEGNGGLEDGWDKRLW